MKKKIDGLFNILKSIYKEQKKQTKMLQVIASNQEQYKSLRLDVEVMQGKVHALEFYERERRIK